jgi:hypothetical protein
MRRLACASIVAAAGCISSPVVVPSGGAERATASAAGATLSVYPAAWDGSPSDLADYVTPIAVELSNAGPAEVRVAFVDFVLVDEHGFRYAALNPFVPEHARAEPEPLGVMVARRGGGGFRVVPAPPPRKSGSYARGTGGGHVGVPPAAHFGAGLAGGGRWSGYSPYASYRPWYGGGPFYWGDPLLAPGYATWVWAWSPTYYPWPTVPQDVVGYALPEGVLAPGGHVDGFLYFARTHDDAQRLALTWEAHDARTNAPVGHG